jgi:hypothetical protein
MEINRNVAPVELIVGISGELCYVTYRDSSGKLNSEKSWTNWSDNSDNPLVIENKFSNGFKLAGVNGRWSRQAANAENMLIEHPLFNKCFEISMSRFIEIAKRCVINNGVFDAELIMTNTRDIVFLDEYQKLDELDLEKQAKLKAEKKKNSKNKIKSSDQVPGNFYIDSKTNNKYCYLGTALVDDKIKYIYLESSVLKSIHKTEILQYGESFNKKIKIGSLVYPSICYVSAHTYYSKEDYDRVNPKSDYDYYYFSDMTYRMRVTASKISMSSSTNTKNIYDEFTEEDWKIVDICYNKDFIISNSTRRYSSDTILKGEKAVNNFREDYLNSKGLK